MQHTCQIILTITAIICIPFMLLAKPFLLRHYHNKGMQHRRLDDHEEQPVVVHGGHGGHGEEVRYPSFLFCCI